MNPQNPPRYRYKIINLARSPERREMMTAQLQKLNIADKADFFPAVDGRELRGQPWVARETRRARYVHRRRGLNYYEIGCALTHRGLWRDLLADGARDFYVILEDDAILSPDTDAVVSALASGDLSAPADFVRLQVTQYARTRYVSLDDLGGGRRLTLDYGPRPDGGVLGVGLTSTTDILKNWLGGTVGYMVSRAGAERLLRHYGELSRPPDVQLTRFWEYDMPPLVVRPHVVDTFRDLASTIFTEDPDHHPVRPFAWWDPRYQVNRVLRAVLRRRDVWNYRRCVLRLRERYGAPDGVSAPTFGHDQGSGDCSGSRASLTAPPF